MKRDAGRLTAAAAMLTHFTRSSPTASALDNLAAILREGRIRGGTRMVRGGTPVVCLCDAPIAELRQMLVRANRRRYEPFGLALERHYAFRMGARPVVYLPIAEAERIVPLDEQWRVVALDLDREPPVDWSFEREWRLAGDLPLPSSGAVALVESWKDAGDLYEVFNGNPPCAGVIPLDDLLGPS
jgi:hypothetical protein